MKGSVVGFLRNGRQGSTKGQIESPFVRDQECITSSERYQVNTVHKIYIYYVSRLRHNIK